MKRGGEGQGPVSYRVSVAHLPAKGLPVWLEADEAQRAELAAAHGLVAVERFRFDLTLTPWQRRGVRASGKVAAALVQSCVISLEPVPADLEAEVSALFVPEGSRLARPPELEGGELVLDAESADPPETFRGDTIDVGALAEEFFALAIDPYPRADGVALPAATGPEASDGQGGPLAEGLGALVRKS